MEFEQLKRGQFHLAFILGKRKCKIQLFIQHSVVETKQNTNQGFVAVPKQVVTLRQTVGGKKNSSSVATEPDAGKSTYMTKQVYHTDATYNEIELSFKITTRTFGVRHEQFQRGEQPYSAVGYGKSFCDKSVLKGHVFYILGIVRNPVICVMCSELSLGKLECMARMTCSCF
jgi:hypothetical protein